MLFLDLDNFKLVNDSLGHEAGDRLLSLVAERLRECLRAEDTAARFGGDEFTVLLEDVTDASDAVRVADKITQALLAPFVLEGREVFVTTSIGIALGTSGRERPTDLSAQRGRGAVPCQGQGHGDLRGLRPSHEHAALERLDLEADLRRAIERGELAVHYQPQIGAPNGQDRGVGGPGALDAPRARSDPSRGVPPGSGGDRS